MAKEKEDVDFTFDTTGFRNGLKDIARGIGNVTRNTIHMAKTVSKGMINAAAKIGILRLAFRGITSAIREMPEIGKTFNIAKEIILKNFLFPVRKAIFPLLQRFLDWVRDNRAMFVKWGQTLVTIFNVVGSAIGRVIEIGKGLLRTFGGFFNRVFGTQIKGLNDLLNILSFKFAVAIEFLSRLLEPVMNTVEPIIKILVDNFSKIMEPFAKIAGNIIDIVSGLLSINDNGNSFITIFKSIADFLGNSAAAALELVNSFIKGIKPNIGGIIDSIQNFISSVSGLVSEFITGKDALNDWKEVFQWLGDFISKTFKVALDMVSTFLDKTTKVHKELKDLLTGEAFKKLEAKGGIGEWFQKEWSDFWKDPLGNIWEKKVDDAVITPSGDIIRTDPADYLIATKTPGSLGKGGSTVNIDFSGITIVVQKGTQEEAVNMANTFVNTIRDVLNQELVSQGAV